MTFFIIHYKFQHAWSSYNDFYIVPLLFLLTFPTRRELILLTTAEPTVPMLYFPFICARFNYITFNIAVQFLMMKISLNCIQMKVHLLKYSLHFECSKLAEIMRCSFYTILQRVRLAYFDNVTEMDRPARNVP